MIKVYSKENCAYCSQAKRYLEKINKPYESLMLNEDFSRDDVVAKFPTARTFPIIVIDNEYIGGYNELRKYYEGD